MFAKGHRFDCKPASPQFLWTYVPLVAFVILSLPILGALLFTSVADWEQRDLYYAFVILGLCFGPNWSFVALYVVTKQKVKTEMPSIGSVRAAMWSSLAAMITPIGLMWLFALAQDYSVRGMGVGVGIILSVTLVSFIFLLPILVLIGWFMGRWIYRTRHPAPVA